MRAHQAVERWVLLTNVLYSVDERAMPSEIDIVAVGTPGLFVIETKHWDRAFLNERKDVVQREAEKLHSKVQKIITAVRRIDPDYGFLGGTFLLTKEREALGGKRRPMVAQSTFFVQSEWQQMLNVGGPAMIADVTIDQFVKAIEPRTKAALTGEVSRLAGVAEMVLLTPKDDRFHRVYRGRDASRRKPVFVHLYDLSAHDGENAERIARRESELLQQFQVSPYVPRVMDTFREVPEYPGELYYFTMADPSAPSLSERAKDETWTTAQRTKFAAESFRALAELLQLGLVHRNISPQTLLVQGDGRPLLTGLHLAKVPDSVTVSPTASPSTDPFRAPELRSSSLALADRRSDVFSLAASLATVLRSAADPIGNAANDVLGRAMADDPAARPTAADAQRELALAAGERVEVPVPPARFWSEGQIVGFAGQDYRIESKLGSGGFGTTFRVVEVDRRNNEDFGSFVAKVIYEGDPAACALRAYKRVKPLSDHPSLALVFATAAEWEADRFVAVMKWIEGQHLGEWAGYVDPYAEEHQMGAEAMVLGWCDVLCDGLARLHQVGLVHGDVSPKNILLNKGRVVLTDYDTVCREGEARWTAGTPSFVPPGVQVGSPARPSDDLFSLAASLFRVTFDRSAFEHAGANLPERGACWAGIDREAWATFADFVDKATAPAAEQRFANAMAARAWLRDRLTPVIGVPALIGSATLEQALPTPDATAIATDGNGGTPSGGANLGSRESTGLPPRPPVDMTVLRPNEVPWLKQLLQTYPGGRYGNVETRGLDSDFAAQTYVETPLDAVLLEEIHARQARLVVLCGNAGDGKTAMLQHILNRLGLGHEPSSQRLRDGVLADGLRVRANLDGSAAYDGRNADELLDELFEPFQSGPPSDDVCHLLAVNDGRLLEWLESYEGRRGNRETWLTGRLRAVLEKEGVDEADGLRFIDLNVRSLVGGSDGNGVSHAFLDRLLDKMLGGGAADQLWSPCTTCSAKFHCPVKQSVDRLTGREGFAHDLVRRRTYAALQAVHQRGEVHITARELRGTLSYIFFGTHYCTEIHDNPDLPHYPDMAFWPLSPRRQGGVLRDLSLLDPALEAQPQIDRQLKLETLARSSGRQPSTQELASARRRAYFEWTDGRVAQVTNDLRSLGLHNGRYLSTFRDVAFMTPEQRAALCRDLCAGISRLEDLPPLVLRRTGRVPLKVSPRTPVESAFWVEKPLDRFELLTEPFVHTKGLETLHRHLRLIYHYAGTDGRTEVLLLNSDLFHLLMELRDGYQIADARSDDTFANLSIFTQRIAQEDERSINVWTPIEEDRVYEVRPAHHNDVQRLELVPEPREKQANA
jgi:serine/threonine protein kinase